LVAAIKKYKVRVIPLVPRVLDLLFSAITRKIRNKRIRKVFVTVVSVSRFLPRQLRRTLFHFVHRELGPTLNTLVSGGSPLSKKNDHFFQGLGYKVMIGYGLSECSPIVCAHFGQFRRYGEVGKPLPGVQVSLSNEGEVIVSGENVFLGYWPNISSDSRLATGDLAVQAKNGNIVLKGRNKNLIVFDSGEKCFCEDLELIVNELDGVEMSCFVEKNRNGAIVAECLIGSKQPNSCIESEVIQWIKKNVPLGINVSRCVFVKDEEFPVTHTLKPNRAEVSRLLN
jgi:long-chain acyl-CoA synthetase